MTLRYYIIATDANNNSVSAPQNISQSFTITISQSPTNSTSPGFLANLDGRFVTLLIFILLLPVIVFLVIYRKNKNKIKKRGV